MAPAIHNYELEAVSGLVAGSHDWSSGYVMAVYMKIYCLASSTLPFLLQPNLAQRMP